MPQAEPTSAHGDPHSHANLHWGRARGKRIGWHERHNHGIVMCGLRGRQETGADTNTALYSLSIHWLV